jgi:hypothetical protein
MMMAQARIDDSVISRLRGQVIARDLIFERVSDKAPVALPTGTRKEKAAYVATTDRTAKARVIADLNLRHE